MTDEYTPTTNEVRAHYISHLPVGTSDRFWAEIARAKGFDRWLVAHDAEVSEAGRRAAFATVTREQVLAAVEKTHYPEGIGVDPRRSSVDTGSDEDIADAIMALLPATVTPSRDEMVNRIADAFAAFAVQNSYTLSASIAEAYEVAEAIFDALAAPPASTTTGPVEPALRCTCPSGDGSLRWPCPAHPPAEDKP